MGLQIWMPLTDNIDNQGLFPMNSPSWKNIVTSYSDGKLGKCYGGQYIYHLNNEILGNSWTLCAWVKSTSWSQYNDIILCKNISESTNYQFYLSIVNGATFNLQVNNAFSATYSYTFATNTWYHVAAIYDGSTYGLYINGELKKTGSYTSSQKTGMNNIGINCRSIDAAGTAQTGDGGKKLNDVRIYDHALSAKEVEEIAKGLVLHYKLDNNGIGNENILTNSTGYMNNSYWSGLITVGNENNSPYLITKRTDTTSSSRTFCHHNPAITSAISSWSAGDKFTISGYYKVPSSETQEVQGNLFIRWSKSSASNADSDTGFYTTNPNSVVKDTWIRFENTYTIPPNWDNTKSANFYLAAFSKGLATIYWKQVKIEKGEKATSWVPAKTDSNYPVGINDIIYDSSGYGNNGTIVGSLETTTPSPRYEIATQFPGTTFIKKENFQIGNIWTLSCWFYSPSSSSHTWSPLVILNNTGGDSDSKFSIYYNQSTGIVQFLANGVYDITQSTTKNAWHHLVSVYDGSILYGYIDGIQKTSKSISNTELNKTNLGIGARCTGAGFSSTSTPFEGNLSDVRIYATALTPEQIKELYNTSMSIDNNGNIHARELVEL